MDDAQSTDVGVTRGRDAVYIVGDGRMFEAATESRLNLLSEWATAQGLWIRFLHSERAGRRCKLELDPAFNPIVDLATGIQDMPTAEDKERLLQEQQLKAEDRKTKETLRLRRFGFAS